MSALLQGRHALVCGGSEGIGLAAAQALAAHLAGRPRASIPIASSLA